MKPTIFTSVFLLLLSYTLCAQDDPGTTILTGPYLGQKPPGMTPEIFAPGIVSTKEFEYALEISYSGDEILFMRKNQIMLVTRSIDGTWSCL